MSCEHLFLVGDIVDGWRLRKSWFWDATHDRVVRLILRHARNGTRITYVPGNHDEMFRAWLPGHARRHNPGGRRASPSARRPSTPPPTAAACWSCTATSSTA